MPRGRHRLDEAPDPDPARPLVCIYFGEPTDGEPSVIRSCLCGAQLWVTALMSPLVESGELIPQCWQCHERSGRDVTLHPVEIDELTRRRRLDEGWRRIDEMNGTD
jgi:hypothetical protein